MSRRKKGPNPPVVPPAFNETTRQQRIEDRFYQISERLSEGEVREAGPDEIVPERLLVFEVSDPSGREEVRNVLEQMAFAWVQERYVEPFEDDFKYTDPSKEFAAIWATVPTISALNELLRLWNIFKKDEKAPYGRGAIFKLFERLRDLRRWGRKIDFQKTRENTCESAFRRLDQTVGLM